MSFNLCELCLNIKSVIRVHGVNPVWVWPIESRWDRVSCKLHVRCTHTLGRHVVVHYWSAESCEFTQWKRYRKRPSLDSHRFLELPWCAFISFFVFVPCGHVLSWRWRALISPSVCSSGWWQSHRQYACTCAGYSIYFNMWASVIIDV